MKHKAVLLFLIATLVSWQAVTQTFGVKKRTPKASEYGNVVMKNHAARVDSDPVVFPHWLHRAKYTCRLCHVDLGFAMTAGETGVSEEDNRNGLYCGACHNGTLAFAPEEAQDEGEPIQHCDRCHSLGKEVELRWSFHEFVKDLPRARFGNRVDWMKAEDEGLVVLEDYLEGISIPARDLMVLEDRQIHADAVGMPAVLFSHEKHTVWNGCELCHPQIFGIRKRAQVYDMQDIFEGRFCGACHGSVAFPNTDCRQCHTEDVF
jgi:c(7)-type cytochrome triheme protein